MSKFPIHFKSASSENLAPYANEESFWGYSEEQKKKLKRFQVKLTDLSQYVDPSSLNYNQHSGRLKLFYSQPDGMSAHSLKMFNSVMNQWIKFSANEGIYPFPPHPLMVMGFLKKLDSENKSINTISQSRAQLSKVCEIAGWTNVCNFPELKRWWNSLRETRIELTGDSVNAKQSAPFRFEHLEQLVDLWFESRILMERRDLAIITTCYATMVREEELTYFRLRHIKADGPNYRIERTRSKTKNHSMVDFMLVDNYATVLTSYLNMVPYLESDSFLFRATSPRGNKLRDTKLDENRKPIFKPMTGQAIDDVFERAYMALHPEMFKDKIASGSKAKRDYDPDGKIWTGHSARIGKFQDAIVLNPELKMNELMEMGDWTSPYMVHLYSRDLAAVNRGNVKTQFKKNLVLKRNLSQS